MEVKIKIKIKDVEIELSRDDLRELRDILDDLFGKGREWIPYPSYPVYPCIPWVYTKWTTERLGTSDGSGNFTLSYR